MRRQKKLRDAFTGPARIDSSFTLGSVIDYSIDLPKRHVYIELQTAVMIATAVKVTVSISPPNNLSSDDLKKWEDEQAEIKYQAQLESQRSKLVPAYRNPKAVKILELLDKKNPSGETLYKIYELAEGDPNNRRYFIYSLA